MGKKGKWFSSLKKALSPEPKEKKEQKLREKSAQKLKLSGPSASDSTVVEALKAPPPPVLVPEEVKTSELNNAQSNNHNSVAVAVPAAAEAIFASAQPVVQVACVTTATRYAGKSKEEVAAIKIQTAFRGFLARRAVRALKGLVRLKLLMEGPVVKRQAANTLRCMQTLSHVQCQIRSRRIRMSEENHALQRQLLQKHVKELVNLQMGEEWDDSLQSKDQIEASLLSKHEAALRRERAMAYSFTHQRTWKNSSKSTNPLYMDPSNPTWGWSWLERWMAGEGCNVLEKEANHDQSSVKSAGRSSIVGEISKAYARYQLNLDRKSPTAAQKPNPATSLQSQSTPSKNATSTVARKLKPRSPRVNTRVLDDNDAKSMVSVQSERPRRHSIGSASVRDDESLASSQGLPSYMIPTESARAKSRFSPVGTETNGTPEKSLAASVKKRLSYPPTPARARRHSLPAKLDTSTNTEISVANRGTS